MRRMHIIINLYNIYSIEKNQFDSKLEKLLGSQLSRVL